MQKKKFIFTVLYLLIVRFAAFALPAQQVVVADGRIDMPVAVCMQYQLTKARRGSSVAPFRRYGFRPMMSADSTKHLWGYHVMRDSAYTKSKPLYRMFRRHDILSFAIIDDVTEGGACQYVFWWKGYYRKFADELRRMDFSMSAPKGSTNILRFSRQDVNVVVDFIIWDDIYVMKVYSRE